MKLFKKISVILVKTKNIEYIFYIFLKKRFIFHFKFRFVLLYSGDFVRILFYLVKHSRWNLVLL